MKKNSFLILSFIFTVWGCNNQKTSVNTSTSIDSSLIEVVAQDLYYQEKTNGQKVESLKNPKALNSNLRLNEFLNEKGVLLALRINDTNCNLCIEAELEDIKILTALLSEKRLVIFATFKNKRSLNLMLSGLTDLEIPVFHFQNTSFSLFADEMNTPYYFTLNQSLTVANTFIPIKGVPNLSSSYFKAISENLNTFD